MISFIAVFLTIVFTTPATAAGAPYGLPAGAVVIESKAVPQQWRANRAIVLWVLKPKKNPLSYGPLEYTCPDETRGSYYSGPTRVSLVDLQTKKIINTVKINEPPDGDSFDIPYKIRASYYDVPGVRRGREGKPTIIALKDYNGDGKALEFAFFDAVACMGLQTTLLGYSLRQDRLIQYPIELSTGGGRREISYWVDYLFSKRPGAARSWKYEIDYRGRGGTLDQYEIRYNPQRERFEGTFESKQ